MSEEQRRSWIVAVDGPCAVGKSSVSREVARRLGFHHLDSGGLYRAVTWYALRQGVDLDDPDALTESARAAKLAIRHEGDQMRVFAGGEDVSDRIRTPDISSAIGSIADVRAIREIINDVQRQFAAGRCVIADGRDIATVVFPHADVRIYLHASASARGLRRFTQYHGKPGHEGETLDSVVSAIEERDARDMAREFGALRRHEAATEIITTDLSYDETVHQLMRAIEERIAEAGYTVATIPCRRVYDEIASERPLSEWIRP
jgi:cytidylate kinase